MPERETWRFLCTAAEAQITEHAGGGGRGIDGLMCTCACARVHVHVWSLCRVRVCVVFASLHVHVCTRMCMCSLWGVCPASLGTIFLWTMAGRVMGLPEAVSFSKEEGEADNTEQKLPFLIRKRPPD